MADEDFVDFDQEWFFDELKGEQTEGTTLDPPLPPSPPPAASSSINNHGSTNQSHQQIQQHMQQPTNQSNAYQDQQMGHRDGMMPSTSTYGMPQQHQPLQEQQQIPVSQHQQHQMTHVQQQSQQQFETLQTYNPNQQNQNIQNHYQQNSQPIVFDMEMDFMQNEASTSSAMPMECRISQEYNQTQQYQQPPQQQQGDNQWMPMEQSSQMSQQHAQHMTSIVYTSTSQQMPRIPDPGGHHTNQPQIINNYNSQQIIPTGINGQTILANMQPVQHLQRIIPQQQQQQSQQQQFELNPNYIQPQIAYIDPTTGSQQFITPGEGGNVINFHQPVMQVIPQIIQSAPPATETPIPPPAPTPTKSKATKNTNRANGRKKNQPPPQPKPQASTEGDSILSKIGAIGSVAVNFNPEKAARMAELMGKMAALEANEAQGYDMTNERTNLENQLEELLTGANIIPQPTPNPPPSKPTPSYTTIAPNSNAASTSTPAPQPKTKKARTKAVGRQDLQQKKAANEAANANNSNVNMQPVPQVIQQQQPSIPPNESGYRIISQDANILIVESNGTLMKAVNVRTENGTATYQILGPVDEKTIYQLNQQQQQPPPQQPPPPSQQQKRVQQTPQSAFKSNENDEAAPAAVIDVVNSLSSSNKSKPQKKTPARSRSKKAPEPPQQTTINEEKPVKKESVKPEPTPTVICVPSASKEPPKPKIVFPAIAVSAKRVKDKTDSRKRRIAEWIKKLKEAIATTDINSPFIDKEDVFNRLMPYGFHYEPDLSQKTMDQFEHELIRHQTHLYDRYKSIEGKMQQIFIRDTTRQNFDLEKNMLLAIDAEYEKQQLEKDKAFAESDRYHFVLQSDIVKSSSLNLENVTETRKLLNLHKPKNIKPTKGFHFEPSHFDEAEFIKRKLDLIKEDEEKEKAERLAAFRKAHPPPPPVQKPSPKPTPPIQTPKLPPKPLIEPVKISLKLQENTTPLNKEASKPKKPIVFTSSSDSSSSDDDYAKSSKSSKSKKSKSFRSPSSQKERKSKSPQKSKPSDLSVSKEKANHVSAANKFNNKHQAPIKATIRKLQPPENPYIPPMHLGNYRIPKIGESVPPPVSINVLPIKKEPPLQKEQPKFIEPKPKEFLKPSEPQKIKENTFKIKENIVEAIKIKKSSLSNSMDNISSNKEKKKEKHHHHHHHRSSSSNNGEQSNSVISNHSNTSSTQKSSKNDERSESLNRETTKIPSLVIKPLQQIKNEIKKEEKRSKEKSSSKDKETKDTVKAEEKPFKTKSEMSKPETSEHLMHQPLKLKINFGSKKSADTPSTSNSVKEIIPSSNNLIAEQPKKKDKKDKHSKESRKEKNVPEDAPPILEIIEEKINHIDKADEEDIAAKEAKRKRKEEKKRQRKLEKKQQKKLEKKQRKEHKDDNQIAKQQIHSPGGDNLRLIIKKPIKPAEIPAPEPSISSSPPLLQPEVAPIEATPKLKFKLPRNVLPESSKKPKKEKDRNLKRESPKVENEPNLEAPPLKIPRVKIKLGGAPQNQMAASSSSTAPPAPILLSPHPKATTSAPVVSIVSITEKKKSVGEKQMENSENTVSLPLQSHPQIERPSMVGQPPNAITENVTAPSAKIRKIKKAKHGGGNGFSDCSDVEEPQMDLRLMTDRILSRCRD